jgi:hypothetical protein
MFIYWNTFNYFMEKYFNFIYFIFYFIKKDIVAREGFDPLTFGLSPNPAVTLPAPPRATPLHNSIALC